LPKFQVDKDKAGKCRFLLRADNKKIVVAREAYPLAFGGILLDKQFTRKTGGERQ